MPGVLLTWERVLDSEIRTPQSALRILVNAGPTREYFDTVRFISNPSTGKQGFAIARAARERGHQVVLVAGPVDLPDVPGVKMIRVTTAAEMADACKAEFEHCEAAILTAAVCDYRPSEQMSHKRAKSDEPLQVRLEPTEDISAALGQTKGRRVIIGFAMDDREGERRAEAKLKRKNCDVIVANGPKNIGSDRVTIRILHRLEGWSEPLSGTKQDIARHVISVLEGLNAVAGHAGQ